MTGSIPYYTLAVAVAALALVAKWVSLLYTKRDPSSQRDISSALFQFYIIVGITILSFVSIVGYFFIHRSAYWDNRFLYSFFHDNLQSLNYFGEPAWWFPHNHLGMPGYFYSILGDMNCISPVFIIIAAVFWLLGRIGIQIPSILPVYIWYFGVIVPFLFVLSVWLLARRILKSSVAIIYVSIIAVFSPGLIFNLSDTGFLEAATYGFFFCAAYLNFLKKPRKRSFLALVLSMAILAVSFNYTFLIWNSLFLPAFILSTLFPKKAFNRVRRALRSVSLKGWILTIGLILLCMLPSLITLTQKGELVKISVGGDSFSYDVRSFMAGSPLEVLFSGTPGVGVYWSYIGKRYIAAIPTFISDHRISYAYIGLLTFPLALWGFIYSRSYWRIRLFILFGIFFSVVLFSSYSPLFLPLLLLPTPLQSVQHFGTSIYRCGGFILLILAAGLGLEFLQKRSPKNRFFVILFIVSVLISTTIILFINHVVKSAYVVILGLTILLGIIFSVLLLWLANIRQSNLDRRLSLGLMLLFVLVDVSTVSHLHVKKVMAHVLINEEKVAGDIAYSDLQRPDGIGIISREANNQAEKDFATSSLLNLRREGLSPEELPLYALFTRAHISKEISKTDFNDALTGRSLALEQENGLVNKFLKTPAGEQIISAGSITLQQKSYSSFQLKVNVNRPALLFVRDGYNPYWKAKVNGQETQVLRALGHFKAVAVPKGESEVLFRFRPPGIIPSLFLAYLSILFISVLWIREFFKQRAYK